MFETHATTELHVYSVCVDKPVVHMDMAHMRTVGHHGAWTEAMQPNNELKMRTDVDEKEYFSFLQPRSERCLFFSMFPSLHSTPVSMVSDIFSPTCTNSKHDPEEKNAVLTEGCERKADGQMGR